MPRKTDKPNRARQMPESLAETTPLLGHLVYATLEAGAYIGIWHNHSFGVNLRVRWENDTEDFYYTTPTELQDAAIEIEDWLHQVSSRPAKKTRT